MKPPFRPIWELPKSLKASQLHRIATLIGAPLSGTKPQLITGIHDILEAVGQHEQKAEDARKSDTNVAQRPKHEALRILSIDMGIRNLAFAFLTSEQSRSTKGIDAVVHGISKPILREWRRTSLTDVVPRSVSELSAGEADTTTKSLSKAVSKATVAESFEPAVLAVHAYNFAAYCTALEPTHILIERQRFRSGGQSAVQEWSLRVGMLEAMLYASFHSMKMEKLRGMSDIVIEPVLPMRVNKYWFRNDDEGDGLAKGKQAKQAKQAKIKKVSQMLEGLGTEHAVFDTSDTVEREIVRTFGSRGRKRGRGVTQSTLGAEQSEEVLSKFDDMADSLLQGLAWMGWQENRLRLLNGGIEALDMRD